MFNEAICGQGVPRYLSTDHDPLFEYHRWKANLRILEVDESKQCRTFDFLIRLFSGLSAPLGESFSTMYCSGTPVTSRESYRISKPITTQSASIRRWLATHR
jgi:hypothetical protein